MLPIEHANSLLSQVKESGIEKIIVSYSGGKDSAAVLDLCVKTFGAENVTAFYLYFLPDLDCDRRWLRMAERRWGVHLHQFPHPEIGNYIRHGILRPYKPSLQQLIHRNYRWKDVESAIRLKSQSYWIASGQRKTDSLQRRGMLNQCGGIWWSTGRVYPIAEWKPKDVLAYLRGNKIPIPQMFGTSIINTSGISLEPECLLFLKKNYPKDYERITSVFNFAAAKIYRQQVLAKQDISQA